MTIPSTAKLTEDSWRLIGADIEFGRSLGGRAQVVSGIWPLWRTEQTYFVNPSTPTEILAWEAFIEKRRGRFAATEITPKLIRRHWAGDADILFSGGIPFTGGIPFGSGADFGGATITLSANANQFAASIEVDDADPLVLGKFFWIDGYMYRVVEIEGTTISIEPPLRAAAASGTELAGTGSVTMTLEDAQTGQITWTHKGGEFVTVSFLETA